MQGHPDRALEECDKALALNPLDIALRTVQVVCLIDLKRNEEARSAFQLLMAPKPPNEEQLRAWFEAHLP